MARPAFQDGTDRVISGTTAELIVYNIDRSSGIVGCVGRSDLHHQNVPILRESIHKVDGLRDVLLGPLESDSPQGILPIIACFR